MNRADRYAEREWFDRMAERNARAARIRGIREPDTIGGGLVVSVALGSIAWIAIFAAIGWI
jgi:hypothetical protein